MTGVALYFGLLILAWWVFALATHSPCFAGLNVVLTSLWGRLAALAWVFCLYYHLCNGIRHLFWDMGRGFELKDARNSGVWVVAASVYFTALTWYLAQ